MDKKSKIMERLHHDMMYVTNKGYKVLGVFLQGSQNYNLDYPGSDIDTKCIVIPSFEDIVLNKQPASTTLILEDNSHIDVKDVRLMWQCFKKQNINFLEILFTKYYIVSSRYELFWNDMREIAERIAHYNNYAAVNCIAGMVMEKNAALCHPYPTLKDKIDKYGYDNKQLHHIIRCEEFLQRYIDGVPYKKCLIPLFPEYLINVKSTYMYSLEEAKEIARKAVENVKEIKQKYMDTHPVSIDDGVETTMTEILVDIMKRSIAEDIKD